MSDQNRRKSKQLVQDQEAAERKAAYQHDIFLTRQSTRKKPQEQASGNSTTGPASTGHGQSDQTSAPRATKSTEKKPSFEMPSTETVFKYVQIGLAVLVPVTVFIGWSQYKATKEDNRQKLERIRNGEYQE